MKKAFCLVLAAVMLLSVNAFASAESGLETTLSGIDVGTSQLSSAPAEKKTMDRADLTQTTDVISLTDSSIVIRTADGLYFSYVCPSEYVVSLSQDVMQQANLYLTFYPSNMTGQAASFIEEGMHLNIFDFETGTDIYLYTFSSPLSQALQNLTSYSETDVKVVESLLTDSWFEDANSVTTGMIGNNLWIFGDYGKGGDMLTFVNGMCIECVMYYGDGAGASTALNLLNNLTIAAA